MACILFETALIFTNVQILKNAIVDYAVAQKREIWFSKNDLERVQAMCSENCLWYLYASRLDNEGGYQIKRYNGDHNCILVHKHKCVRSDWLASYYGNQIRANPRWKLREFQQHVSKMHNLIVSKNQCWLAKKVALSEIDAEVAKQYKRIYDYGAEVLRSNPNSTCKIKVDRPDPTKLGTFQRIYICFGALKEGFSKGCKKVIGLDGCFLKSYVRGELLSAVAKDGNDQMYPIAWAIVEVESTNSWSWFIKLLKEDLELGSGHGYTVMTDQQKGLKHAIDEILPGAEHRCCARHIYANWRKNHAGAVLKTLFWKAAKSCTEPEFNLYMEEIKQISPQAYEDLLRTESKYWSRAYFNTESLSDMVDNNLLECFNAWIVEARYKPILDLLDMIRLQVMERLHQKRDFMKDIDCRICPRILKKLNYAIDGTKFCKSTWTGGDECEVRDVNGGQWVVNIVKKTCSCRRWELSWIHCSHGCQALYSMNLNPEDMVDSIYSKSIYMEAYQHLLKPMKGSLHWPKTNFLDILPPKERRMPGRPKKHRRKEQGEEGGSGKISKKGVIMKCSQCLHTGHNKATCKASLEEIAQRHAEAAENRKTMMEKEKKAAAIQV